MSHKNLFCALALVLSATPVLAAGYDAELDPVPFDPSNRAIVVNSIGDASATLDGGTLTVKGNFSNFTSPATGGSLRIGLAKGVPGDAIGSLTADHARPPEHFPVRSRAERRPDRRPEEAGDLYPHRQRKGA